MITLLVTVFAMMWINAVEMRSFGAIEIMAEHALDERVMIANRGLIGECINPIGKQVEKPCQVNTDCCDHFLPPVSSEARVQVSFLILVESLIVCVCCS